MPVIEIKTNCKLTEQDKTKLAKCVIGVIADEMKKPIPRIMGFVDEAKGVMNESTENMMFISVKCKNEMGVEEKAKVCEALLGAVQEVVYIEDTRVYVQFSPIQEACAWQFSEGKASSDVKINGVM